MPYEANSSNVFILDHLEHLSDLTGPLGDLIGPPSDLILPPSDLIGPQRDLHRSLRNFFGFPCDLMVLK